MYSRLGLHLDGVCTLIIRKKETPSFLWRQSAVHLLPAQSAGPWLLRSSVIALVPGLRGQNYTDIEALLPTVPSLG